MAGNVAYGGQANRIPLILGITLGLITAVLIYVYLSEQGQGKAGVSQQPSSEVVTAAREIPAGTRLTTDMLTAREIPNDLILAGSFQAAQPLVGQVTRFPISAGEQVSKGDLGGAALPQGTKAADAPLSFIIPPGKRAISVPISETIGAGGLIRPGDFVDVIGVFDVVFYGVKPEDPLSKQEAPNYLASAVLQNVEVLAVAQQIEAVVPADREQNSPAGQRVPLDQPKSDPKATTITLAVTVEDAQKLFMAEQKGKLKIALRPFGETEIPPIKPLTDPEFLPASLIPPYFKQR